MKISFISAMAIVIPATAFAGDHCAVPDQQTVAESELKAPVQPVGNLAAPAPTPVLQHVSASGAQVIPLGSEYGMRTFAAHAKGHFMVFDETPDGQALVSGIVMQIPMKTMLSMADGRVQELASAHGLRTFFLGTGDHFQVFYATPDQQRLIPGVMWDASGKNVTRQQLANVPGTTPTVELGNVHTPSRGIDAHSVDDAALLQHLVETNAGTIGQTSAPRAWMFVDPQCSFSVRALQELLPAVTSGALQLAVIPLSILDHEDDGASTRHALAMLDRPAAEMVRDWSRDNLSGQPGPATAGKLAVNMAAAQVASLRGTPTFFWQKKDGSVGRMDGVPESADALIAAIRS
ncbi:MAG: hypothetical protein ACRYHQ_19735 [Janthinobacterium lividum]